MGKNANIQRIEIKVQHIKNNWLFLNIFSTNLCFSPDETLKKLMDLQFIDNIMF